MVAWGLAPPPRPAGCAPARPAVPHPAAAGVPRCRRALHPAPCTLRPSATGVPRTPPPCAPAPRDDGHQAEPNVGGVGLPQNGLAQRHAQHRLGSLDHVGKGHSHLGWRGGGQSRVRAGRTTPGAGRRQPWAAGRCGAGGARAPGSRPAAPPPRAWLKDRHALTWPIVWNSATGSSALMSLPSTCHPGGEGGGACAAAAAAAAAASEPQPSAGQVCPAQPGPAQPGPGPGPCPCPRSAPAAPAAGA